jgi:hypothetical protein
MIVNNLGHCQQRRVLFTIVTMIFFGGALGLQPKDSEELSAEDGSWGYFILLTSMLVIFF